MFAVGLDAALDIGDPRVPVAMILKPRADSFIHKRSLDIVRIRSFLNLFLYLRVQTGRPFHKGTALYMTVINLPRNRRILPDMAHPGDCPRTVYVFPSISWPKLSAQRTRSAHSFVPIRVNSCSFGPKSTPTYKTNIINRNRSFPGGHSAQTGCISLLEESQIR